jgi:hypothetical protein
MLFTMSMDRFACGLPDPQEAPVITECAWCGGEIYGGEAIEFDFGALPERNRNAQRVSRTSDYMHVDCWEECADAHWLTRDERELLAELVEVA